MLSRFCLPACFKRAGALSPFAPGLLSAVAAIGLMAVSVHPVTAQHGDSMSFSRPAASSGVWQAFGPADTPRLNITVTPRRMGSAAASSGQLVCVRTCDGFYFPVGAGGTSDRSVAEFMCQTSCPGATTKVFARHGEEIENAVGSDKSLYRKLAAALSFRKAVSPTCTCHKPGVAARSAPVYDDPTLRAGDVIVVDGRAVVFKGGAQRPYSERDFAALEHSALPSEARNTINARLLLRSSITAASKRSQTRVAATTNGSDSNVTARTAGIARAPRVVLPHPFEFDALPESASAFAPVR